MADCQDVPTDDHGGDSDGLSVSTSVQSSSLPVFTGTLDLHLDGGPVGPVVHWLLSSPGGIHFRKLTFSWFREEDVSLTMALMGGCSHTLESLHVCSDSYGTTIRYLRPHGSFISVSRRAKVSFVQPLKGDKAQGCCFSARIAAS